MEICKYCKYAVYGNGRIYTCSKYNSVCYSDTPNFKACTELLGLNDTVTEEELKNISQTDIALLLIEMKRENEMYHLLNDEVITDEEFNTGIIGNDEEARKTDKEIYYKVHRVFWCCGRELISDTYVIKRYKPSYARLIANRTGFKMEPVNENIKYVKDIYAYNCKKIITESDLEYKKIIIESTNYIVHNK